MGRMKALVTGAAGFIGGALVRRLRDRGQLIIGADLRTNADAEVALDVSDPQSVRTVLQAHRPTVIVHAAAIVDDRGDPSLFERVNVAGTGHMLEAASDAGCRRFVQLSSIAALGIDPGMGANAQSPLVDDTGSPYIPKRAPKHSYVPGSARRAWRSSSFAQAMCTGRAASPGSSVHSS